MNDRTNAKREADKPNDAARVLSEEAYHEHIVRCRINKSEATTSSDIALSEHDYSQRQIIKALRADRGAAYSKLKRAKPLASLLLGELVRIKVYDYTLSREDMISMYENLKMRLDFFLDGESNE